MRVFIDSNIIISAILFPKGKTSYVFCHLMARHTIIISSYTKDECIEVFKKKFPDKTNLISTFFENINYEEFKTPSSIDYTKYPKIRDIKDLPVLASAILADADILMTGDKDFEEIKIARPLIFTPAKYYELISNA